MVLLKENHFVRIQFLKKAFLFKIIYCFYNVNNIYILIKPPILLIQKRIDIYFQIQICKKYLVGSFHERKSEYFIP